MTHEDAGHYRAKHPSDTRLDPRVGDAIKARASDGRITCAAAHKTAGELHISPADVGVAIDLLETRIINCQLGLFGHSPEKKAVKPAESVPRELEDAIRGSVVNNRITCLASWQIAERFGIAKIDVSAACESLAVKIGGCQLGAFQ